MIITIDYFYCAGCPRIVRSDYGTENCLLASAQMALRHDHHDIFAGSSSYRYGKSTTNTVCYVPNTARIYSFRFVPYDIQEN